MNNLSVAFSFKDDMKKKINFKKRNGEECILVYSDNGSSIKEIVSESIPSALLFNQLIKQ